MVENIQFRNVNDQFLNTLKNDIKKIQNCDKMFVPADKTRNLYKMESKDYEKLLTESITQKYKHADAQITKDIDREFNSITEELDISDRIEKMVKTRAFITLKDHKDNFSTKPTCRLINPAKSEIGKVSKIMLDRINSNLRDKLNVNQWRNTSAVLEWFSALNNKANLSFIVFDIVDFYPSITPQLLDRALTWATQYTTIPDIEYRTIMHARKSLLFDSKGEPWVKSNTANAFDVTMGGYDGAEVCELVGLLALHNMRVRTGIAEIGLYRDDGLAALNNHTGSEADRLRKSLIRLFADIGLKITIQANLKTVNYLDATLDLRSGTHRPYMKPNNEPVYIDRQSNHPPTITKQIPAAIGKRISLLSSNAEIFNTAAQHYNKALRDSNYPDNIEFLDEKRPAAEEPKKKNRSRKIVWFNPPYSKNVKTNVGRTFLRLLSKHFPKEHRYHKILNRNNVKVSYSCMPNVGTIIKSHNSKITRTAEPTTELKCNCRRKEECPLNGRCQHKALIYEATITSGDVKKTYIGLSGGNFKERFNNHTKSFKNEKYKKETELSKYVWDLKNRKVNYCITWRIVKSSNTQRRQSGQCNLCVEEKLAILNSKDANLLNKRTELVSKCRHGNTKRKK